MALAKKCDRCGDFYIPEVIRVQGIKGGGTNFNAFMLIDRDSANNSYTNRGYVDLCPNCLKEFGEWFTSRIKIEKEKDNVET